MYLIYTTALTLGLVVTLPYYAVRFRKYLPTLRERMGFVDPVGGPQPVWIHAVSVGELRAVDPLIRALRHRRAGQPLVLSTTTPTGRALAMKRGDVDRVVYFPLDLPGAIRRALGRIDPAMVIIAETEIWPNFLRMCARRRVPVFLLNGRVSDRSFGRYRLARRWLGRVLDDYVLLGMQSAGDAERIRDLGARDDRVAVFGNLKYDVDRTPEGVEPALRSALEAWQPLIIAASTAAGEEKLVLEAFRRLAERHRAAKLLLAPRRTDRFDEVARLLDAEGFAWCRRSTLQSGLEGARVLLLDTIGELSALFELGSVVFMGGTLVPRGGHNILEAVRFGKPVLFGPHMDNFRDMAREFLGVDAAVQVKDPADLASQLDRLLADPARARSMAEAGQRLILKNRGATDRALDAILDTDRASMGAGTR